MAWQAKPGGVVRLARRAVDSLWSAGADGASRSRRFAFSVARVSYIAAEGFVNDLCLLRAGGLAFISLLALVPTFAIVVTILRAIGWHGTRLEELILTRATVLSPEAIATVVKYIDNTSFTALGVAGVLVLAMTVVSVMANIEEAFNAIWGNIEPRSLVRRLTDYLGVVIVAPLLLGVAASATAVVVKAPIAVTLQAKWGFLSVATSILEYGAYGIVWLVFAFLYVFMPNTRVHIFAALVGGVIAGSVWQFTQWMYIGFQANVGQYNAIYGALAQLPVLMAWFYLSWLIVLFGAEIAYGVQNVKLYALDRKTRREAGRSLDDYVALGVCTALAKSLPGGRDAIHADEMANSIGVPPRCTAVILERLRRGGVIEPARDRSRWRLALQPEKLRVAALLRMVEGYLPRDVAHDDSRLGDVIRGLLDRISDSRDQALAGLTVRELLASSQESSSRTDGA